MPGSAPDVLTQIRVALGKIEVSTANTERRLEGVEKTLDQVIEDSDLEPLRARLTSLEAAQSWVLRGLLGAGGSVLLAYLYLSRKVGI